MPESSSPWRAAARIICAKRSIRRARLRSIHVVGSKSFSSQAKWTPKSEWSNDVISAAPDSPAVHEQHLTGNELGGVRAQEPYCPGHILRIAEPTQRCVLEHQRPHLLRDLVRQPAGYVPGSDDVRAHATAAELPRERLREADDPGLGRRV